MNAQQRRRKYASHRAGCKCARKGNTCYVNSYNGEPRTTIGDRIHGYFISKSNARYIKKRDKERDMT